MSVAESHQGTGAVGGDRRSGVSGAGAHPGRTTGSAPVEPGKRFGSRAAVWIGIGLVALVVAGIAGWFRMQEARYGGHTVAQWLVILNANDPVLLRQNIARLREVGPVLVEPLSRIARTKPPLVVRALEPVVSRIPAVLGLPLPNVTWYQVRRYQALRALSFIGPQSAAAVPVLIAALEENDYAMGGGARMALTGVGAAAVPELGRLMRRTSDAVAAQAAQALGEMGEGATGAIADLEYVIAKGAFYPGLMAAHALGQIGKSALPAVERCLTNSNPSIRAEAIDALGRWDGKSERYLNALEAALRDEDRGVREIAEKLSARP